MEKKTYEEILMILKEKIEDVDSFAHEDYNADELGLGEIIEVNQEGGEGQGDHWESVKYFKDHNVYIMIIGSYSSYEGASFYNGWKCCSEVRPKEKTITVYE